MILLVNSAEAVEVLQVREQFRIGYTPIKKRNVMAGNHTGLNYGGSHEISSANNQKPPASGSSPEAPFTQEVGCCRRAG